MSQQQLLTSGYDVPLITVDSADFDGTNDSMARGAALTGISGGKTGTLSAWCRIDATGTQYVFFIGATLVDARFGLNWSSATDDFTVFGYDSGGVNRLAMVTSGSYTEGATWRHILASWNVETGARHLYINDVSDKAGTDTSSDGTIDYAQDAYCGIFLSTSRWNGCLAEVFFHTTYIDLSVVTNRRRFISHTGKPVFLGTNGAIPLNVQPLVYFHLDDAEAVANFATNRGTGGDFTITGTLETGSTSPSD